MTETMSQKQRREASKWTAFGLATLLSLTLSMFIWFVWYPIAGYSQVTLWIALLSTGCLALGLLTFHGLGPRRIGLTVRRVGFALAAVLVAYVFAGVAGAVYQAFFGSNVSLWRADLSALALFDNWVLTALFEELLFCGVLFTLAATGIKGRRRWAVVVLVAVLFALFHLPGYVARSMATPQLLIALAMNTVSWLFFGSMYALSNNLWLSALAHAATDYPLVPAVTDVPLIGILFMSCLVVLAWWLGRGEDAQALPDFDHAPRHFSA